VVFLVQLPIVFIQVRQTEEVGARVFFGDFVTEARRILASVRGWRGGNGLSEGE
jgi:hypothetical protein